MHTYEQLTDRVSKTKHICIYIYIHSFWNPISQLFVYYIYAWFLKPYMHSEHLGPVLSTGAAIWALRYHFFAMYCILSSKAAFCRQVLHSERLGSISSTCIPFWAPRQRFVDRCHILSAEVAFLWQVSHSERPDRVLSTGVAFWPPEQHFFGKYFLNKCDCIDTCRILSAQAMFLARLGGLSSTGVAFCALQFCIDFLWFFLRILLNLASLNDWVSF